ncbi:Fic family protein [Leptospira bandrabouensis]|uniref:Fic family protein n=1 Tax=Leptospira bandrabouensis TaxID=2484903 RepID=UPI001EE85E9B|nr:Fic family protein [Leptospira bandrabouensis]MCG6146513.1 Fic family protein [Leptospira bandrabouensis]MCG6161885.1 Fic family protein [Leptospira bandrabouensis]MCG6166064.1 Fic family protein [Leptospira bandrabouensis]
MNKYTLPLLPPAKDLESKAVLKACVSANASLAELKGVCGSIPNEGILINTLATQEAKESSAIENIITTHDELYKEELFPEFLQNASAKEVQRYSQALKEGFRLVKEEGLLTSRTILTIQEVLEKNQAGFRTQSGTVIKNDLTGEVIYTPPQNPEEILSLMKNLEVYINDDLLSSVEPLVKMAVIHYQFESIHPFYDGNGRTGRIINILYLVLQKLLDIPVLYLSRYIIQNKNDYYRLFQVVREEDDWESWILYILKGVDETSKQTIQTIQEIRDLMAEFKARLRSEVKFYSNDLLHSLFQHPYTKIEWIERDLEVTRKTASKYLDELCEAKFLRKEKIGKSHFYVNEELFELLSLRRPKI